MIYQVSIEEARACLGDIVTLAYWRGDDFIITRGGTPVVSLVSIKQLEPSGERVLVGKDNIKRMSRWTSSKV